jgi:hypothetical protein
MRLRRSATTRRPGRATGAGSPPTRGWWQRAHRAPIWMSPPSGPAAEALDGKAHLLREEGSGMERAQLVDALAARGWRLLASVCGVEQSGSSLGS